MAKKAYKIPKDLTELPTGWSTREELASLILQDMVDAIPWQILHRCSTINSIDDALRLFFMKNSWQLTSLGAETLIHVYKSWLLDHQDNAKINGRVLINMSNIVKSPWYNHGRYTYVWKETVHFEMMMFNGSIKDYVEFYLPK
jgi:hypothetical protein